jgi:DNA polymerase
MSARPAFLELVKSPHMQYEIEAHNVFFERSLWQNVLMPRYGFPSIPDSKWRCSAALASSYALPRALDKVGDSLELSIQKDATGKLNMLQMCKPRPARSKEDPKGVYWHEDHKRMITLLEYCVVDVLAEREISNKLPPLTPSELEIWQLDQKINMRGIPLDKETINSAIEVSKNYTVFLEKEMDRLTKGRLTNIRQTAKLQLFLEEHGVLVDNVQKATIVEVLQRDNLPDIVRDILTIRQSLGQTSTAKYIKMKNIVGGDEVARDQFMYHGASTGRWAAKGFQPQNLPRGTIEATEEMFEDLRAGSWRVLEHKYGSVIDVLVSCIRGMIKAPSGNKFLVSDFSNIEGRVLAWIAGETWKVQAFEEFDNETDR